MSVAAYKLHVPQGACQAALVAKSLAEFWRAVWDIVEPSRELIWSWHMDALCEHLEAVTAGDIKQLTIQIPPGMAKSLAVSVFWPAWEWLRAPSTRRLFSSHSLSVINRDSMRARMIVQSERYVQWADAVAEMQGREKWTVPKDRASLRVFHNTMTGFRQCVTVNSGITGDRADGIIVDDPVDVKAVLGAPSQVNQRMAQVNDWYDKVLSSRLNDKRTGCRVLIMQRVHKMDLAGHLSQRDGVEVLCLPQEYNPGHKYVYAKDPRTEPGELLCPALYPREVVDDIKADELGAGDFEAQHNQNPVQSEGKMFRRDWVQESLDVASPYREDRCYRTSPYDEAARCDEVGIFIDCAFKGGSKNDPTCFLVVGRRRQLRILLGRFNARMSFVETCDELEQFCKLWPMAVTKLVEDKANGPALISAMSEQVDCLEAFNPDKHGDKWARAKFTAREWRRGQWRFPHPDTNPWVVEYLEQMLGFDSLPHDEDVDCSSMASIYWNDEIATRDIGNTERILGAIRGALG